MEVISNGGSALGILPDFIWTCLAKMSRITKFVINLPKIMEKAKKFQKMNLIIIKIGSYSSNQEVWYKK